LIESGCAKDRKAEGTDREVVVINGYAQFGAIEVVITLGPIELLLFVFGERGKGWINDLGFFICCRATGEDNGDCERDCGNASAH
jgi:hypothetical protein